MDQLPQDQEFIYRFELWRNTEVDRSSELEISQDTQRKLMRAMIQREDTTTEEFFDAVNGLSIHLILERHTVQMVMFQYPSSSLVGLPQGTIVIALPIYTPHEKMSHILPLQPRTTCVRHVS